MPKLTMRFFLISLSFMLFFSCKSYDAKNNLKFEAKQTSFVNPYFANPETDYVYKAHIEVYGNKLGGIFVAKKINDTIHRVVFTTDFGNKLLDFEISENDFKVNYVLEELNRNIIINTLRDDFRLLLKTNYDKVATCNAPFETIYKSTTSKRNNYFFVKKSENKIYKLISTTTRKEKVSFDFESKNGIFAENIKITHHNIKLKIELNQIIN